MFFAVFDLITHQRKRCFIVPRHDWTKLLYVTFKVSQSDCRCNQGQPLASTAEPWLLLRPFPPLQDCDWSTRTLIRIQSRGSRLEISQKPFFPPSSFSP